MTHLQGATRYATGHRYRGHLTDRKHGLLSIVGAGSFGASDGRATLTVRADERHLNAAGTVHGGLLATVDATMGAAIRSAVEDETSATSQLTLTCLRPGEPGQLVVTAEARKRGDRLTICEADVEQDGTSLVHALATFAPTDG